MRWNACCHCVSALRVRLAGIGCHCVAALRLRLVGIGWSVSDTNFYWIQKATLAPWNRSAECALERLLPLRFSAASAPCGDRLPLRCGAAAAPCRDRLERFGNEFFLDSQSNVSPLDRFCLPFRFGGEASPCVDRVDPCWAKLRVSDRTFEAENSFSQAPLQTCQVEQEQMRPAGVLCCTRICPEAFDEAYKHMKQFPQLMTPYRISELDCYRDLMARDQLA